MSEGVPMNDFSCTYTGGVCGGVYLQLRCMVAVWGTIHVHVPHEWFQLHCVVASVEVHVYLLKGFSCTVWLHVTTFQYGSICVRLNLIHVERWGPGYKLYRHFSLHFCVRSQFYTCLLLKLLSDQQGTCTTGFYAEFLLWGGVGASYSNMYMYM